MYGPSTRRHTDSSFVTSPTSDVKQEILGADLSHDVVNLARHGGLRPFLRLGLVALWTLVCITVLWIGRLALVALPKRRPRWRSWVVRRWARGLGALIGMRVTVTGPVPRAPFFLVANHLSYIDIILLFGLLDCVFVSKHEVRSGPVVGFLTRSVDTIFVNRDRPRDAVRVLEQIDQAVAAGDGVVVFPEGTSSEGGSVYPMKPALFEWAARNGYPVHFAAIRYECDPDSPPAWQAVSWWGDAPFAPHVMQLLRLPRFRAEVTFGAAPLKSEDRGELALLAQAAIAQLFVPMVSKEMIPG